MEIDDENKVIMEDLSSKSSKTVKKERELELERCYKAKTFAEHDLDEFEATLKKQKMNTSMQ